jgi:hypothetical protein
MNKKTIYTVLVATVFLSAFHLFLACVYHYTTTVSDVAGVFDLSTWSYPYRRDVASLNLMIVFIGVAASVIGYIVRIHETATGE